MSEMSSTVESGRAASENKPWAAEHRDSVCSELSQSHENLRAEVERLRNELQVSQAKFDSWQDKAKQGVNQLRQRVLTLTGSLRQAASERDELKAKLAAHAECAHSPCPTVGGDPKTSFAHSRAEAPADSSHATDETASVKLSYTAAQPPLDGSSISQDISRVIDPFVAYVLSCTSDVLEARMVYAVNKIDTMTAVAAQYASEACSIAHDFDSYKRRTTMTLRLQTKNYETLQNHVTELDSALRATKDEVTMRDHSLLGRDDAIAQLEKKIEELNSAKQQLKSELETNMHVLDMQQVNVLEGQMEHRVDQMRAEYAQLEFTLRAQHRADLNQQRAMHEEETQLLRNELKDMMCAAALHKPTTQNKLAARDTVLLSEDAAYNDLFRDYRELEHAYDILKRENADLKWHSRLAMNGDKLATPQVGSGGELEDALAMNTHAADLRHAASNGTTTDVADGGQGIFATEFGTLQEAKAVVMKLQGRLKFSADELWKAKREIFKLQKACLQETLPSGALGAQQVIYMRSVVVQLLCSNNRTDVMKHLISVLIKLLHLDDNAVQQIYQSNPTWRA